MTAKAGDIAPTRASPSSAVAQAGRLIGITQKAGDVVDGWTARLGWVRAEQPRPFLWLPTSCELLMFHPLLRTVAVSVAVQGGCERRVLIMCPEGDVDRAGAKECVAQLRYLMACRPLPSVVVIDLGEVRFLGVSGVDVLLGWAADAAEHGISIQFLLPARLKRMMMRIGVSAEFARFAPTRKILGGT